MDLCIAYEPTFRDFLSLNRWIVRRRWRAVRLLAIVLLGIFLAGAPLFHDLEAEGFLLPYAQSLAVLALPALVVAGLPVALYVAVKKRWNAAPEIREPRRFTFTEGGVVVEGGTFSGRVAWSHIIGAETHRGLVILKTNQGTYYLFSERAFPDADRREEFATLVRKKVSPTFGRSSVLGRVKFLETSRNVDRDA